MRQRRSIFALLFGPARYVGTASGAPLVVAAEVVPVWQTACPTIAAAAQRYFLADGRRLIRCSGDTSNPNGFVRRLDLSAVPVVEVQATRGTMSGKDRVSIPKGFKPAFTDGRFNRKRGVGTDAGQRQMELIWTNTVPRRLVDKRTGREVTRRQVAVSSKTAPDAAFAQPKSKSAKSISANSVSANFVSANSTSASYVQVGTFGVPANAAALVKRFQRMGLPVAISKTHMGGRPVEVVLAGPFNDRTRLKAALTTARRAGFSDAFIR